MTKLTGCQPEPNTNMVRGTTPDILQGQGTLNNRVNIISNTLVEVEAMVDEIYHCLFENGENKREDGVAVNDKPIMKRVDNIAVRSDRIRDKLQMVIERLF